jgi:hypothetical protein
MTLLLAFLFGNIARYLYPPYPTAPSRGLTCESFTVPFVIVRGCDQYNTVIKFGLAMLLLSALIVKINPGVVSCVDSLSRTIWDAFLKE